MVDITRWLAEHGLGHHAATFRENGIAGDVLHDLTEADLRELGLNIGDRKRLLKAVAALDAAPTGAPHLSASPPTRAPSAERRQLTVMFADLVVGGRQRVLSGWKPLCGRRLSRSPGAA